MDPLETAECIETLGNGAEVWTRLGNTDIASKLADMALALLDKKPKAAKR